MSDATRLVFDSQLHVWEETEVSPQNADMAARLANHGGASPTPEKVIGLMNDSRVTRGTIVPASFLNDSTNPEVVNSGNEYSLRMAESNSTRFCVMGRISLSDPGRWKNMSGWLSRPGMRGVRLVFTRGTAGWLDDGTADWFWPEAEANQIPVMVFAPRLSESLARVAARHPDLSLIVDHGNLPTSGAGPDLDDLVAGVCALAQFPKVTVKASALPIALPEAYPFPAASAVTRRLVDAFGPQRVFWGSDFTRARYSYDEGVTFLEASGLFSDSELTWIMGKGLAEALHWPADEAGH
jgi:predicted TIM-barrel fold metal-dependent hydrolase